MTDNKIENFYLPMVMLATAFVILLLTLYPYYQKNNLSDSTSVSIPTIDIFRYSCPQTAWIDCMPGPGATKPQCQSAYLDWAKTNCPNFKGIAY